MSLHCVLSHKMLPLSAISVSCVYGHVTAPYKLYYYYYYRTSLMWLMIIEIATRQNEGENYER